MRDLFSESGRGILAAALAWFVGVGAASADSASLRVTTFAGGGDGDAWLLPTT